MTNYVKFLDGPKGGASVAYASSDYPMILEGGEYRIEPDMFAPLNIVESAETAALDNIYHAEWHRHEDQLDNK